MITSPFHLYFRRSNQLQCTSHSCHNWIKMKSINRSAPNIWTVFMVQLVEHCSANAEARDSNPVEHKTRTWSNFVRMLTILPQCRTCSDVRLRSSVDRIIPEVKNRHACTEHWWFSGRILACHAGDPGSIPGWCRASVCMSLLFSRSSGNTLIKLYTDFNYAEWKTSWQLL